MEVERYIAFEDCSAGDIVRVDGQMDIYHNVVQMVRINAQYDGMSSYPEVFLTDYIHEISELQDISDELCIPVTVKLLYETGTNIEQKPRYIEYSTNSGSISLYPNEGYSVSKLYRTILLEVQTTSICYAVGYLIQRQVEGIQSFNTMIVTELLDADMNPVLGQ